MKDTKKTFFQKEIELYTNTLALFTLFTVLILLTTSIIKTNNLFNKSLFGFIGVIIGVIIILIMWSLEQNKKREIKLRRK